MLMSGGGASSSFVETDRRPTAATATMKKRGDKGDRPLSLLRAVVNLAPVVQGGPLLLRCSPCRRGPPRRYLSFLLLTHRTHTDHTDTSRRRDRRRQIILLVNDERLLCWSFHFLVLRNSSSCFATTPLHAVRVTFNPRLPPLPPPPSTTARAPRRLLATPYSLHPHHWQEVGHSDRCNHHS